VPRERFCVFHFFRPLWRRRNYVFGGCRSSAIWITGRSRGSHFAGVRCGPFAYTFWNGDSRPSFARVEVASRRLHNDTHCTIASPADMPDLVTLFEQNAIAAAALVWRCERTPLAVRTAVERATAGAHSIVFCDPEFLPTPLFAGLRGLAGVIAKPDEEQLATAEVGVTEAFAGVASTGTVCVALGRSLTGASSLLMPLHIALLPVERLVERPRDIFDPNRFNGDGLRRNLVFITGPSATADMGPLVLGVHGPHRVHILLLE